MILCMTMHHLWLGVLFSKGLTLSWLPLRTPRSNLIQLSNFPSFQQEVIQANTDNDQNKCPPSPPLPNLHQVIKIP